VRGVKAFLQRTLIAAEMQGRQLLRRRLALAILVALPVALYLAMLSQSKESAIEFGALGMSWSVACAALFAVLAAREAEPRLVLIGFRPAELMLGRFLLLLGGGTAFAALVGVAMTLASAPVSVAALFGSCLLVPPIAVSLGLAVAAILPHDLEGTLVIIGLVGIQLALSGGAWVNGILPMNGPIQLAYLAGGFPADPVGLMLVHSLVYVVALLAIAAAGWSLRVRVRRGRPAAPVQ
jgi:hypothetical protein